ncbi:hypothetical protein [Pseudomonas sp. CCOS 191]|uniref:hypothetical protein n=1 Tax=Pseudomonas sp. CCOS 191 TaxID=1649877 RepID=UPI0012E020F5|nr:hypothetical protein [Pseudomonas sp. CCOS 191]
MIDYAPVKRFFQKNQKLCEIHPSRPGYLRARLLPADLACGSPAGNYQKQKGRSLRIALF